MKRDKIKTISLFLTVFCFFGGAVILAVGVTNTVSPTEVTVTLYQTDLLADQNATAVNVFSNSTGTTVDVVNNPNGAFGQGSVAVGMYKRIKFTVQNAVSFTGPDPCDTSGTPPTITKAFLIDPVQAETAQVELYFATSDDGGSGSGWLANGTSSTPFLLQNPVEVKSGVTNVVKLIFGTANTLACDNSNQQVLLRPDMNVVNTYIEPPLACTANFPQQYWYSTFEINNTLFDQQGVFSVPSMTTILQQTGVVARWGTVTFNKPDANGNGTAVATLNTTYDNPATPGVAQNRHTLGQDCTATGGAECGDGYFNPIDALASSPTVTINYTMNGGKIIVNTSDGGQEQGYFSDDCSAYVGVNISSNKMNTLNFGLKKPSGMANQFPADAKFALIGPAFGIHYNPTTHIANDFGFGPVDAIISSSTGASLRTFFLSWRNAFGFTPNYTTGTSWNSSPAEEASAEIGTTPQYPSVRTDGLFTQSSSTDFSFSAFGSNGSVITAASTTNIALPMYAGMWINVDLSPSYSDMSGNWIVGGMHAQANLGADNLWGTGDESPQFGMTYGSLEINGDARTYSGTFTFRDVFSGEITSATLTGNVELRTDCYAYDPGSNQGLSVTTPAESCTINGIQGITLPVFYLSGRDQYGNTHATMKFVLDVSKKLIGSWDVPDTDGVPCQGYGSSGCTPDPAPSTGTGIGIKAP